MAWSSGRPLPGRCSGDGSVGDGGIGSVGGVSGAVRPGCRGVRQGRGRDAVGADEGPDVGGDHGFHAGRGGAAEVEDGLDGLHLDAGAGELEPAGADAGHEPADDAAEPVGHAAEGQAAGGAFGVGEEAAHGACALAGGGQGAGVEVIAQEGDQLLAAVVADQQPLVPLPGHVADGDVGEHVGVVHAGAAGEREEVGRELGDGQAEERDGAHPAGCVAELDLVVGAELQVGDRFRRVIQQV